jgi:hypothetical protein
MDIKPYLEIIPNEIKTYVEDIDINYATPKDVIIGTFIGRTLELQVSKLDISVPNEIQITYGTSQINARKQPTFITKSYELDPDTGEYLIKGMDYSAKFDDYLNIEIPEEITNGELVQLICNYLGVGIESLDFANAGFLMTARKVDNKFTYRNIIAMVAADMGGIAFINGNDKVEFKKITVKNIIIENIFNTAIRNEKIGPINSVVIAREPQQDYINVKDDESITTYGKTEVKITNNWLIDDNREGAMQGIYDNLHGIEFYCAIIESYQGFEVDPFDLVNISGRKILINNINIKYPLILDGTIGIEQLSKLEIKQNIAKGLEKRVINAELKVDKIEGQITSVVEQTDVTNVQVTQISQTIKDININLQQAGGLNLIQDSTLRLGLASNIKTGTITVEQNKEISDNTISKSAIKINTGSIKFALVKTNDNINYTFSCIIYKVALANVTVKITSATTETYTIIAEPGKFIPFEFDIENPSGQITIEILCDNNYCLVADCMLNKGAKLSYQLYAGEVLNENYMFGLNGLEITSSAKSTKSIFNADGTRILNSETGKTKADFNGDNTTLDRVTVQERINIGNLRFTVMQNGHTMVTFDEE